MWTSLKKLRSILNHEDRSRLAFLLLPFAVLALLELLGIFSILPFMQIVANPEILETNDRFRWFNAYFEFSSRRSMLIWMGIAILAVYASTAICTVVTQWLTFRVVWGIAHRITMNVLTRYTRLPYEYFLNHNSADMIKKAISDVRTLVSGVVMAICQFAFNLLKTVLILLLLFLVNGKLALLSLVVFGGAYFLIHIIRHRYLEDLGRQRLETVSVRIKTFSETIAGIKTLRVSGSTDWFVKRFEKASRTFCNIHPKFQLLSMLPRVLIELLAFGGIIIVILYQLFAGNELNSIIPTLSLFAMATYKLLPALSSLFLQVAQLSHNLPVVDEIYADIQQFKEQLQPAEDFARAEPIPFSNNITLENVSYQYESSGMAVLSNINLEIPRLMKCAFVGPTGCGKSTLIDIIVGLIQPNEGQLLVDSVPISPENVFRWQQRIAYVPQDVFLCDDSIAANIALGIPSESWDQERLKKATRLAQVDEFLNSEFREGVDTIVGEQGARLSGGQRQRIGLARAIYSQPDVLVLDEATSALDSVTEEAIVSAMENELPDMTIIMIAHRLTSSRYCDRIYFMDEGKILNFGSYDELLQQNKKFRHMVEVAE